MRAFFAEMVLGWRRAIRGPTLGLMACAALLCLGLLPGVSEEASVKLGYGLAIWWTLLLVAAMWQGGTTYARDREQHLLTLNMTKPQSAWLRWWGRWLGTLPSFFALTVLTMLLLVPRTLPEGRAVLSPELPDLKRAAEEMLVRMRAAGRVPEGVAEWRLLDAVAEGIVNNPTTLTADTPQTYTFVPPGKVSAQATFRLQGNPFFGVRDAIRINVEMQSGDNTLTHEVMAPLGHGFAFTTPEGFVQPGCPLTVTLRRIDTTPMSGVIYHERRDIQLLLPGISAEANLIRFGILLFVTLAMAAALGAALGCCFSLPVTLFTGALTLLAIAAATLAPGTTVIAESLNGWAKVSAFISHGLASPFTTLVALNPLYALTEGEALPLRTMGGFILASALPWLLIASLFGALSPVKDKA